MNKINRYNLLVVLAVLMVSLFQACNDDAPEQRDRLPVKFSGTVKNDNSGDAARAIKAADGLVVLDFSDGDEIILDAWRVRYNEIPNKPDFIYHEPLIRNNGVWEYTALGKYWSETDTLAFFAAYLPDATRYTISEECNSYGYPTIEFDCRNVDGGDYAKDFLATPMTYHTQSTLIDGKVPLQFKARWTKSRMKPL